MLESNQQVYSSHNKAARPADRAGERRARCAGECSEKRVACFHASSRTRGRAWCSQDVGETALPSSTFMPHLAGLHAPSTIRRSPASNHPKVRYEDPARKCGRNTSRSRARETTRWRRSRSRNYRRDGSAGLLDRDRRSSQPLPCGPSTQTGAVRPGGSHTGRERSGARPSVPEEMWRDIGWIGDYSG